MHNFIICGHSHSRRFGSFTRSPYNGADIRNLGLARGDVRFGFHGEGGMRINQLNRPGSASNLFFELFSGAKVCILFIGDNDVLSYAPQYLAEVILEKASIIKNNYQFESVFVAPLLPRREGAQGNIFRYNRDAARVNRFLKVKSIDYNVQIMKELFPFPATNAMVYERQADLFLPDGVHLNALGNRRLYNHMRGMAIRSTK